jgi:hypothetical protein
VTDVVTDVVATPASLLGQLGGLLEPEPGPALEAAPRLQVQHIETRRVGPEPEREPEPQLEPEPEPEPHPEPGYKVTQTFWTERNDTIPQTLHLLVTAPGIKLIDGTAI